ncbi:MAG: MBL fold metallo-hydrolase [Clostridiales bacterium]|nr:MBL fold metallo-hydrolase [Clostridiales bacterium]
MQILSFCYGLASANMYVLLFGKEAVVIDPCCPFSETGLEDVDVKAALCTHGHFDHISEIDDIYSRFHCPIYISKEDQNMLYDPILNHGVDFGLQVSVSAPSSIFPGLDLKSADFGFSDPDAFSLKIVSTPGHTPGSSCFLFTTKESEKHMFTGDMLFMRSIGRTDLGGSYADMTRSIDLLRSMDDDIVCYPGHGPETVLGIEKKNNPYF